MTSAFIAGLDTPAGAYLARLLRARGYAVAGTARDGDAAQAMLATLGADEVSLVATPDEPAPREAYLLDGRVALADLWPTARVFVAAGPHGDDGAAAAARAAGRFVVAGALYGHASRLDPPDSLPLAVIAAVRDGRPVALPDRDVRHDLGWTPEYVDAMWRMLQAPVAADAVIASGFGLGGRDIALHAAEYFKRTPDLPPAGPAPPAELGDPAALAGLGWRAFTHGRELVRTLCEGFTA